MEWLTVLALLGLSVMLIGKLKKFNDSTPSWVKLGTAGLAFLSFLAAGEEISWGQRLFGFQASESFQKLNYQRETNLHNLMPAELFNGLIIFAVGFALVLIPLALRHRYEEDPWWLPSRELSIVTLDVILINHYRVSSLPEKIGLVMLVIVLAVLTVNSLRHRWWRDFGGCLVGWLTAGTLYWCRRLLPAANQQYEIRELLVILVVAAYCHRALSRRTGDESQPGT